MSKTMLYLKLVFYGLLFSSLIGLISFLFIYLESNLSHYLWDSLLKQETFKNVFILLVCISGGLLIGTLRKRWGAYPLTAHQTIGALRNQGTVTYRPVFKSLAVALLILVFGAGVGPEAALLAAIVMLSVWQSDKLRYFYYHQDTFLEVTFFEELKRMLHPTNYLMTFDEALPTAKMSQFKKIANTLFIFNGLFGFVVLMKRTQQPSFITKMGISHWQPKELILLIPLVLVGLLVGKVYLYFSKKIANAFNRLGNKPILKALIGSFTIYMIAIFTPSLLFSGQTSLGAVPLDYQDYSVLILLFVVVLKLLFLQVCLNTGWVGGDIFPVVFSAIIFGHGVSLLVPMFDTVFVVSVVATTMSMAMLNAGLLVAVFVALFFPLTLFPVILMTGLVLKYVQTKRATRQR